MKIMIEAYLDNNIGDDLMIKILAKNFKEHTFYLYSNSTVVKETFSNTINIKVKEFQMRKFDISNIDIYLSIGGSIFQLMHWKQYILRLLKIIRLYKMRKKGIKIVTLGSNFGPYSSKFGVKLTELELRQNSLITVRDKNSFEIINTFKKVSNYHYAEDIVYNYRDEISEEKEGLGISAYRSLKADEINFENYMALAKIADHYINRTGKTVSLFAFDSEYENDIVAAHYIYNLSNRKDKIDIIPYIGNEESFLSRFKKCERMIAIRFHSGILSDLYKIPFLPISYSNKMENLMNDRKFKGDILKLNQLNLNYDIESIVNKIISKEGLYTNFSYDKSSSSIHLNEFRKLL